LHKKRALKKREEKREKRKERREKREEKREKSSGGVGFRSGRKSGLGLGLPVFRESRRQHTSKQGGPHEAPQAVKTAIGKKVVGGRPIRCHKEAEGSRRKEE
jgi:hypothetical protein